MVDFAVNIGLFQYMKKKGHHSDGLKDLIYL